MTSITKFAPARARAAYIFAIMIMPGVTVKALDAQYTKGTRLLVEASSESFGLSL